MAYCDVPSPATVFKTAGGIKHFRNLHSACFQVLAEVLKAIYFYHVLSIVHVVVIDAIIVSNGRQSAAGTTGAGTNLYVASVSRVKATTYPSSCGQGTAIARGNLVLRRRLDLTCI